MTQQSVDGLRTLSRGGPAYPPELERLPDPPQTLRARGARPVLSRAVAIVGTRTPTPRGEGFARLLARELASAGCVIVSGGAVGIDHAAHLGALDAGCTTVVVHASGLARPYPAEHRGLYERVVRAGGCELSERPDDGWPAPSHFLARNRIIAALSRVVVVVEAAVRSGALSTAAHARAIGIPVLAVPRVPEVPEARGSNDLIRSGARPCMGAIDVLEIVEGSVTLALPEPARRPTRARGSPREPSRATAAAPLDPLLRRVFVAVESGASDLEAIVESTGLSVREAAAAIAELEILGLVLESGRGRIAPLG